jgi:phage shock protein PspC (stress-responsive transcriptional regulator)
MNKAVSVNIGGIFFHFDENAYQHLSNYLNAVKRSLSQSTGWDEIMKDIEIRVSELLLEKQKSDKQVVNIQLVNDVIAIMGEPADFDSGESKNTHIQNSISTKKLYRDSEHNRVGGVASGLGYYFGIEAIWMRLGFVVLVLAGFGFGLIGYIILWLVTPKAVTTCEILEMKGEPVNISSIENKVKQEYENLSNTIKKKDFFSQPQLSQSKNEIESFLNKILNIALKFVGFILTTFGLLSLLFLLLLFTVASNGFIFNFPFQSYVDALNFINLPVWMPMVLLGLIVAIPLVSVVFLGLKLIISKYNGLGKIANLSLMSVWFLAVFAFGLLVAKQYNATAINGSFVQKEALHLMPMDTLIVKCKSYENWVGTSSIIRTDDNKSEIVSTNVLIDIKNTQQKSAYIEIIKKAKADNRRLADASANAIDYQFGMLNNEITLDNFLKTDLKNKFRNQEVKLQIYLPQGQFFKLQSDNDNLIPIISEAVNMNSNNNENLYQMTQNGIQCLNCNSDNN